MVKLELNKKNEWMELPDESPEGFYLDGYIKEKLDNVLEIQRKGWDAVILIDGRERSGKSTLGMACAWYLSKKKFTMDNFAKGIDDAKQKIKILPNKSILMIDEGSIVFNSKDSRNRENIELQKIMDVVGQKNMIFIVVLPSIFDLSRSLACRRSLFLLHVFVDENWKRGRWAYYGEEKKEALYVEGKLHYNKYVVEPELTGVFTKFEPPFNEEYIKFKEQTLIAALDGNGKEGNKKMDDLIREVYKWKYTISVLMKNVPLKSQEQFSRIVGVTSDKIRRWGRYEELMGKMFGITNFYRPTPNNFIR